MSIKHIHIVVPLKDAESQVKFSEYLVGAAESMNKEGYWPSEIEYHYQQTDRFLSCLVVGKTNRNI